MTEPIAPEPGLPWDSPPLVALAAAIANSYAERLGRPIVEAIADEPDPALVAERLYAAEAAVLCHTTHDDPLFQYVNQTAQRLWEREWAEFIGLPSRLSARPDAREVRAAMLQDVGERGYTTGYSGVRVSSSGALFTIDDAELWQVRDADGTLIGVAARLPSWTPLLSGE